MFLLLYLSLCQHNCILAYLHDEPVGVDDQEERHEVAEEWVHEDVALAEPVVGQVVSSAGSHVALRHVPESDLIVSLYFFIKGYNFFH